MALATLSIDLVVKLAQFESDLKQVAAASQRTADQIASAFKDAGSAIEDFGKGLLGFVSVDWFVDMIKGANEAQAQLLNLSKEVQTTVEALGSLQFAATQVGVSTESVTSALGKLNVNAAAAAAGSAKAADPFIKMGIAISDLKTLSPDELLQKIADKFGTYEEGANKAALGNALFGRGYKEILPLLDDGSVALNENAEFWKTWSGVTTESAKAADTLSAKFGDFWLVTKSFWTHLVNELNPALGTLVDRLTEASTKSNDSKTAAQNLAQLFRSLAEAVALVVEQMRLLDADFDLLTNKSTVFANAMKNAAKSFTATDWLTDPMGTLVTTVEAATTRITPALRNISTAYKNTTAQIKKDTDNFIRDLNASTQSANPFDNAAFDASGTAAGKVQAPGLDPKAAAAAAALQKAWDAMTKKLLDAQIAADTTDTAFKTLQKTQEQIASDPKLQQAPDTLKAQWEATALGVDKTTIAYKSNKEAIDLYVKAETAAIEVARKFDDAQKQQIETLLKNTPTEQAAALTDLEDRIRKAGYSASVTAELINQMYGIKADPTLEALSEVDKAVQDLGHTIQSTLGTALQDALEGNFKGIGDAFKKMIEDMVVKATQADLADLLLGKQFAAGGAGKVGGWLGSLVGMFTGSGGGGGGALGAGTDIAGAALGDFSGGGGNTVNISYDIAAGVSRNDLAALMPVMVNQTKGAVLDTMRRPGFTGG
jgi:hypothetical protein